RQSGLWDAGVTVERYWNDLVAPTWDIGSTTRTPYAHLMAQHITAPHLSADEVRRRAERFVQFYLQASVIDPVWRSLFVALRTDEGVTILVATDHYAEATDHIARQIAAMEWCVAALQVDETGKVLQQRVAVAGGASQSSRAVLLASSADLGARKTAPLFWQRVQRGAALQPQHILVIDDFGANENLLDPYADPASVQRRQAQTIAAICEAFGASVQTHAFVLDRAVTDAAALLSAYRAQVEAVTARVMGTRL
ncbi:hypothetical protein, partial [Roseiflexus sp.]